MPKKKQEDLKSRYTGVRKRKNAATWYYRIKKVQPDGSLVEKEVGGFTTALEASEARAAALAELKKTGTFSEDRRKRYSDVYKEFIEKLGPKRAYATRKRYDVLYRNHLEPAFGDKFVYKITTADVEAFLVRLTQPRIDNRTGKQILYSQEYINGFWKVLKVTLDYAVKSKYINRNPLLDMEKVTGGRKKAKGKVLEPDVIAQLSERFKTTNLHPAFYISYFTGMRCSEVFGLLWSDINFKERTIDVNKQLLFQDGIWTLTALKTDEAAYRKILIPEDLYVYLHILYEKQQYEKKQLGKAYRNNHRTQVYTEHEEELILEGLPFVNIKPNGERLTSESVKILPRIAKEIGIEFKFHWLRHTAATMMAAAGMEHEYLRVRLGHTKIETTLKYYTHESEEIKERATQILNSISVKEYVPKEPTIWDEEEEEKIDLGGYSGGYFKEGRFYKR